MAAQSIIAARRQRALESLDRNNRFLASTLGISPPEDIPGGVREPSLRETVRIERFEEFAVRVNKSVKSLVEVMTAPPKKGANGN